MLEHIGSFIVFGWNLFFAQNSFGKDLKRKEMKKRGEEPRSQPAQFPPGPFSSLPRPSSLVAQRCRAGAPPSFSFSSADSPAPLRSGFFNLPSGTAGFPSGGKPNPPYPRLPCQKRSSKPF
jgi:hypothetical protein